jgi:predicted O-linked N-acetylglucosamine transferase (SPINDLY family)
MQTADSLVQAAFNAHQNGDVENARRLYQEALKLDPRHFNALQLLGVLAIQQSDYATANGWLEQALRVVPDSEPALLNHALVLQELKHSEAALACYDKVLARNASHAVAQNGRGLVLHSLGREDEAFSALEASTRADPSFAEAAFNFGTMLDRHGERDRARAEYQRALISNPDYVDALYHLGVLLLNELQHAEGKALLERVLVLDPGHRMAKNHRALVAWQACDWTDFDARRGAILSDVADGVAAATTFQFLSVTDDPKLQLALASSEFRDLGLDRIEAARFSSVDPSGTGTIRLAYISGDFREHAVSYLTAGLFEQHDRARFEVIGISFGPNTQDAMYRRLAAAFDRFIDVSALSAEDAAARVRSLQVDIAIDLAGATRNARSAIFAHRAAPVQISFLGFPGTGYPVHDYIIADRYVIPEGFDEDYIEACVRMPEVFQVNDHKRQMSQLPVTRQQYGLPEAGFVFCVFHASSKINPQMFSIWMRLLRAVDHSVLWLAIGDPDVQENLRHEAVKRGVAETRLVFTSVIAYDQHLARYGLADLVLDTFPFNGGTTTSDALFAGLPIVTVSGRAFASRMTGSLLNAVGLPDLIAKDLGAYEALALTLAQSPARLRELKAQLLRARTDSPLFDTARFARQLEQAFETMLERWRADLPPQSFAVDGAAAPVASGRAEPQAAKADQLPRTRTLWARLTGR